MLCTRDCKFAIFYTILRQIVANYREILLLICVNLLQINILLNIVTFKSGEKLMRKVLFMAVMACLMTASVALAEVKIGVVDMQVVASESEPAKDAKKKMESKFGTEKKQLEKQGKDLQKKAEALQGNDNKDKQVEFIRLRREFDEKTRNFALKVEKDEVKLRQDMVTLVFKAAYEVARRKGFDYVVDVTAGGVLYAEKDMDLTKEIVEEVNKLWKSGAVKK